MKTKSRTLILALCILSINLFSQVEIDKTKSTLTGKNSLFVESIPESVLDHFNINFYTYFMGSDAGGNAGKGNNNTATIEAEIEGLDSQLAQEITDDAYLYFLEKWKERGIIVKCPTPDEIEAAKLFIKDKSKGKAQLVKPGNYTEGNEYAKYLRVIPTNTAQVKKEYYGNFVYGNAQFFHTDYSGNFSSVNFHLDLNFISFKTGFGTQAAIKGKVGLSSTSGGSIVLWVKAKNLAAGYSNEGIGGTDFYENDGTKLYAATEKGDRSSATIWTIKIIKEKYKATALEIIKKSIDGQLAEYDANVAKEK